MKMDNRITQEEIRKTNRQQIYRFIYHNPRSSSPGICAALGFSRPTVTSNLAALEEEGMIFKAGLQETGQIGRRPVLYSIVPDYRVAVGLEILENRINIVAVNLYGKQIALISPHIRYVNDDSYYKTVCGQTVSFIKSLHLSEGQVLGIGITMQGLVSPDGKLLIYGEILGNTGTEIGVFEKYLPYACCFIHDPVAAAFSEMHISPEITDVLYMSLSAHLGGAIISNRHVETGKHGHNATFEHIRAFANGKKCYCGQYGCWATVCSQPALVGEEEPEDFFVRMRCGSEPERESWHAFLTHLARLIRDLHLTNDRDIMLGGRLAPFFTKEDIAFLYDEIRRICPFTEDDDFILLSKMPAYHIAIGAALKYIHGFLDE